MSAFPVTAMPRPLGTWFEPWALALRNISPEVSGTGESDGGSSDGTPEVVARTVVDFGAMLLNDHQSPLHRIVTPCHGIHGKGSAFRTIFEIAWRLKAKACAVVDSDLRSITPEWIELLFSSMLEEGYDYAAPSYLRHIYIRPVRAKHGLIKSYS